MNIRLYMLASVLVSCGSSLNAMDPQVAVYAAADKIKSATNVADVPKLYEEYVGALRRAHNVELVVSTVMDSAQQVKHTANTWGYFENAVYAINNLASARMLLAQAGKIIQQQQ